MLATQNTISLDNARIKISEKYRKQRQRLRQIRKDKKDVSSYIPGGFSTKLVSDNEIDFTKNEVEVTFVDDNDVPYVFETLIDEDDKYVSI